MCDFYMERCEAGEEGGRVGGREAHLAEGVGDVGEPPKQVPQLAGRGEDAARLDDSAQQRPHARAHCGDR